MVTPREDYYPDHDGGKFAPILATTVATWRAPAFLENLAVDAEGAIFVTVYSHNRVDRYDPATGATTPFAELPAPPMGLAFDAGDRPVVPKWPGSNGIKIGQGWAWITVSGRRLLVRVPIQPDGSAGAIENAAGRLCADDIAFGMSGSLYITTHPEHTLVRLDPSGARTTLAGPDQGMVGSTACAFGRAPGDEKALYVTTDGGFLIPHESGIQDAKLVRLEVGESGRSLL
jgi:sugar lactone lactonase YvrE